MVVLTVSKAGFSGSIPARGTMKYLIIGDTHGSMMAVKHIVEVASSLGISHLIQLGDFGYLREIKGVVGDHLSAVNYMLKEADLHLDFIAGNHDNYALYERYAAFHDDEAPTKLLSNITWLPRGWVWEQDSVKFMALGGAASVYKRGAPSGTTWWTQERITSHNVETAINNGPVDVMLTHDCPVVTPELRVAFMKGVPPEEQYDADQNRNQLLRVVKGVNPRMVIHGHYHYAYTAKHNGVTYKGLADCSQEDDACLFVFDTERWDEGAVCEYAV